MKKLVILFLLLLAGSAWGQATEFEQAVFGTYTATLDSVDGDTLYVGLPDNRGKALILGYFKADSLKATTVLDSFNIRYRQAWIGMDTAYTTTNYSRGYAKSAAWNGSATAQAWTFAKIYNGVNLANTTFDSTATAIIPANRRSTPGGWIPVVFDMDGLPWRGMQVWIDHVGGRVAEAASDSIKYYFQLDVD